MKFGFVVPTCREGFYNPVPFGTPGHFVKAAKLAEKLGFYSIWANDHLNPTKEAASRFPQRPNLYESLITLSFMASATKRIRVGTAALIVPQRDVVVMAKQVATLDVLSGGRLLLGVGVGVYPEEWKTVRPSDVGAHRGRMMEEALEAMSLLFLRDMVSFSGKYYQFQDIFLYPKPIQRAFPFYISGRTADTPDRIARWGRGWLLSGSSVEGLRERIEGLKPVMEKAGRSISEIDMATTTGISVDSNYDKAAARFQALLKENEKEHPDRHHIKTNNLIGRPADIVKQIKALADEGVTHCILQEFPVATFDEMLEQVQMFGEEVIPLAKNL